MFCVILDKPFGEHTPEPSVESLYFSYLSGPVISSDSGTAVFSLRICKRRGRGILEHT